MNIGSVAIVSHRFWQSHFGGNADTAVGAQLRTNRGNLTIIGVMPPTFYFPPMHPDPTDVWIPVSRPIPRLGPPIARLKSGVTVEASARELAYLLDSINREYSEAGNLQGEVKSLLDYTVNTSWRTLLSLLFTAGTLILVIAIVNVANLTLAHNRSREREIAIRSAVGSPRNRLVRQFLVESLLLASLGGSLGIASAYWGAHVIVSILPPTFSRPQQVGIDLNVLGFSFATILLSAIAFGLLPSVSCSRPSLDSMLKEGSGSAGSRWPRRFHFILIEIEVALSTILLAGGLILAKNFVQLLDTSLGMDIDDVVTLRLSFPLSKYPTGPSRAEFLMNLKERLRSQPNVESVAISNMSGLGRLGTSPVWWDGLASVNKPLVSFVVGDPSLFKVLRIEFKSGHPFRDGERGVVVTESFAREHFPEGNILGKDLYVSSPTNRMPILGIVEDFSYSGLTRGMGSPIIIPPAGGEVSLLVRTKDISNTMLVIRHELRGMDPELVANLSTLRQSFDQSLPVAQPRFRAIIFGSFAVVSLLLAFVGIYGVTSYAASQRQHEVGIRLALGGTMFSILGVIIWQSMKHVLRGITIGIPAALVLIGTYPAYFEGARLRESIIFGTTPLILVLIALLASWIPLQKTARIDPMATLRRP